MLDLNYQDSTAQICVEIASSSVNGIDAYHNSDMHQPTERYSSVTYLSTAIIPLICVILKESYNTDLKATAVASWQKALAVLQDIAPGLTLARHTLQRLRHIIHATNRAITTKWQTSNRITDDTRLSGQDAYAQDSYDGFGLGLGSEAIRDPFDILLEPFNNIANGDYLKWNDAADVLWFNNDRRT